MRLAEEYDAAQERGEMARAGNSSRQEELISASDIRLTHKEVHEARHLRDAEAAGSGIVQRTINDMVARGEKIRSIAKVVGTSLDRGEELDAFSKLKGICLPMVSSRDTVILVINRGAQMLGLRMSAVAAMAVLAIGFSADEVSAAQKLCVSTTGATRVIKTNERCRKVETAVVVPDAVKGDTIKATSYTVPGNGRYLRLFTADGGSSLVLECGNANSVFWFAENSSVTAGQVYTFNNISGQPFQAFNDLYYNGGAMDVSLAPSIPWAGVFVSKYGTSLSRFEVTVSKANAQNDCLMTLFSIGLGNARIE